MLGEEASEAKNKFYKNDRTNHTRKCDRISTMSDLFYRSMDGSDHVISSLRLKNCKEREQHFPKEALCMLNRGVKHIYNLESTKENCDAPSPKRRRETSSVWQHFKKTADKAKAICNHCGKTLKTAGNTTNLMDHLKHIHPSYKEEENTLDSPKLDVFLHRSVEYVPDSQHKKMLDKYVMLMIAKDVQPFSMVADEGFLDLMKKMDPKYKLPSRNYFRDVMLPKLYDEIN